MSPLVAPTTVNLSCFSLSAFLIFLLIRKNSKRFPSNCNATSLKAKVGPWNNSRTKVLSFNFFKGVMSGCLNVLYDFSTKARSSDRESSLGEMNSERTSVEISMKLYSLHLDCHPSGSWGMDSGMYRPPFGARPVKTVYMKPRQVSKRIQPAKTY